MASRIDSRRVSTTSRLKMSPYKRFHLTLVITSRGNASGGVEVSPESGIDAIVSHVVEEAGQHILRVEVGYASGDGNIKTLRKFYRFQVSNPLIIGESTFRSSDTCCFVSISLENDGIESKGGLTVCEAEFEPANGLTAERVGPQSKSQSLMSGTDMFDRSGRLEPGQTLRYLFRVSSEPRVDSRGIAAGDELGKVVFQWRKACGELGRMASAPILSPALSPFVGSRDPVSVMAEGRHSPFVVHCKGKSGLSVDVAAASAVRSANPTMDRNTLDQLFPVTVEPVNPPSRMELGVPSKIHFLIINHSEQEMTLQLQFRLEDMKGVAVCGSSFKNLHEVHARGGSASAFVSFVPLACGHVQIGGCTVVDLNRSVSFPQPSLFEVIVNAPGSNQ